MTELEKALKERYKEEEAMREEIAAAQREEYKAWEKRMGRPITQQDNEYWSIGEKYKHRYWDEIVEPRKKIEKEAKKIDENTDEVFEPGKPQPIGKIERICKTCDNIIPPSGKRGRPATRCQSCRDGDSNKKAKAPIDDMEVIMLEMK